MISVSIFQILKKKTVILSSKSGISRQFVSWLMAVAWALQQHPFLSSSFSHAKERTEFEAEKGRRTVLHLLHLAPEILPVLFFLSIFCFLRLPHFSLCPVFYLRKHFVPSRGSSDTECEIRHRAEGGNCVATHRAEENYSASVYNFGVF